MSPTVFGQVYTHGKMEGETSAINFQAHHPSAECVVSFAQNRLTVLTDGALSAILIDGAKAGRVIAHGAQVQVRLKETRRRHDLATQAVVCEESAQLACG